MNTVIVIVSFLMYVGCILSIINTTQEWKKYIKYLKEKNNNEKI